MRRLVAIVFGVYSVLSVAAQDKFTLSGFVKDSLSGESLIGATISVNGHGKGITSNQYGFYSITMPRGTYTVITSFTGYEPQQIEITFDKNIEQHFFLAPKTVL